MSRTLWLVVGIISILGGIFAFFNPLSATFAAEQLAGFTFLLVGILQFIALFRAHSTTGKVLAAIGGVLGVLLGIELLQNPLQGILTLTMVVAILFMATGIVRVVVAFGLRKTVAFIPLLISGLISIALAVMIFSGYPQSATYMLGVLLAVELISNGISLIMYSRVQPLLVRNI
ncbi:HdeD family acid-resistance protein [Psychrobacter sp.]|uniref:HdeD family acid-resistance protein n=1 Tax=Psychrobacter sp. TaxID=56811 RepID=UPI003BB17D47